MLNIQYKRTKEGAVTDPARQRNGIRLLWARCRVSEFEALNRREAVMPERKAWLGTRASAERSSILSIRPASLVSLLQWSADWQQKALNKNKNQLLIKCGGGNTKRRRGSHRCGASANRRAPWCSSDRTGHRRSLCAERSGCLHQRLRSRKRRGKLKERRRTQELYSMEAHPATVRTTLGSC